MNFILFPWSTICCIYYFFFFLTSNNHFIKKVTNSAQYKCLQCRVSNLVFTLSLLFVQLEIQTVVAVFQRVIYYPLAL